MFSELTEFFSFSSPNVRTVALGTVLLGASSALVGCFTFLRKRSLSGDVVSHSVLPGICLAFMISGEKNPVLILIGAFLTGWLSLLLVDWVKRNTRLGEDAGLGISLSIFFGLGIVMLTSIQKSGNAEQAGLDRFLFGKAAAMLEEDLYVFGSLAVLLMIAVLVFLKEFTLVAFDIAFARSAGVPVRLIETILTTLTVLAVVAGIQAVGVVLMAALLITPSVAARFWTEKLKVMLIIAAGIGAISGLTGAFISYILPAMPTGPWIVVTATVFAILSGIFAPKQGVLSRLFIKLGNNLRITEENILKKMYQIGEAEGNFLRSYSSGNILSARHDLQGKLGIGLIRLGWKGFVKKSEGQWMLTEQGLQKGKRITRLHRLWELYLHNYLRIDPTHVHEDAETIEHFITPEIEEMLELELNHPAKDPHNVEIPRS